MNVLIFEGFIVDGSGGHSDMVIPGRMHLSNAPQDWPIKLRPGSLNVKVEQWPEGFAAPTGRSRGVYQLDDRGFEPAFLIPGVLITNNKVTWQGEPAPAQVWKARLTMLYSGNKKIECWVLRRLGSNVGKGGLGNILEIVSHEPIRQVYGVKTNERVTVTIIEG